MFYNLKAGSKLMDDSNYTSAIREYLHGERELIRNHLSEYQCVIEVGCAWGRNLDVVEGLGLNYIGIDYSEEYIELAKRQWGESIKREFLLMDAHNLEGLPSCSSIYNRYDKHLYFFPFNSFGNMLFPNRIVSSFAHLENSDFMIFTYQTSNEANMNRLKYYQNCGYSNINLSTASGYSVRFTSSEGLDCSAYEDSFFYNLSLLNNLECSITHFGRIGKMVTYAYNHNSS